MQENANDFKNFKDRYEDIKSESVYYKSVVDDLLAIPSDGKTPDGVFVGIETDLKHFDKVKDWVNSKNKQQDADLTNIANLNGANKSEIDAVRKEMAAAIKTMREKH